jgi:hypothetical protein
MTSMAGNEPGAPPNSSPGRTLGAMWLYSALRFGLFFALWGILYLVGVPVFFAALIGLALSIPLSLVLLAKPRAAMSANLEQRLTQRREQADDLDARLNSDE